MNRKDFIEFDLNVLLEEIRDLREQKADLDRRIKNKLKRIKLLRKQLEDKNER